MYTSSLLSNVPVTASLSSSLTNFILYFSITSLASLLKINIGSYLEVSVSPRVPSDLPSPKTNVSFAYNESFSALYILVV